jgi:hypothetical protein
MPVKDWEIIADNLSKAGWSCGYVSALDSQGRTIWIADPHRGDGKRFVAAVIEPLSGLAGLGDHGKPRVSQLQSRCSQAAKYAP